LGFAFATANRVLGQQLSSAHATPGRARIARTPAPIRRDGTPVPFAGPSSGTPGSTAIRDGRSDSRERRRQPDSRATVDASRGHRALHRGSHAGDRDLHLAGGDAVFHEAHAPPETSSLPVSRPA
jgi:hypothetical protein